MSPLNLLLILSSWPFYLVIMNNSLERSTIINCLVSFDDLFITFIKASKSLFSFNVPLEKFKVREFME
mgnify:CR=1 FL=1